MPSSRGQARKWLLAASALLGSAALAVRLGQPDALAGFVLVPASFWLVPGLLLTGWGAVRQRVRLWGPVAGVWVAFTFACVEETYSLGRWIAQQAGLRNSAHSDETIRVVSLNCNVGASPAEIIPFQPDIVLLQESPQQRTLEAIARQLYGERGSVLWTSDVSIIADGEIRPRFVDSASHFVHGTVIRPDGRTIEVICLRLAPPVPRIDIWSLGWWREQRDKRKEHRGEVRAVVQSLQRLPEDGPIVLGGDFNTPAGDAALWALRPRLIDAFTVAGIGWGNTATNSMPLWRVDQIWCNRELTPASVVTRRSTRSDHRLVIAEFALQSPRAEASR